MHNKKRALQLLLLLLFMQITLFFAIALNIAIVRAILGFVYVSLLPGFVIVRLLNPKLERVEQLLFAVGISLSFFMVLGLLVSFFGFSLGISKPLESTVILVPASILMDIFSFYMWRTSKDAVGNQGSVTQPQNRQLKWFAAFLCLLPLLSIIGTSLVNIPPHSNIFVLLLMLSVIVALIIAISVYGRLPSRVYLWVIFAIALALLFHFSLFSNYVIGGDIFGEYYQLNYTLWRSSWDVLSLGRLNAMLSVTLLPAIYCNITGISGTWVFKIVYPLIYALVPLGLYQLFKSQIKEKLAFLAVFFFMSNSVFFVELVELPRQMMGELFFILLFLTMFKRNLQSQLKLVFFSIFSFGIVVSHYALAYIFFGFIFAYWLFNLVRARATRTRVGSITISFVLLFASVLFTWYIYTASGSTYNDLLGTLDILGSNFARDFLSPQSRSDIVLTAIGTPVSTSPLRLTGQYLFSFAAFLILFGFVARFVKHKKHFFKNDFNVFAFFALILLGACVVVPNLAGTFNMERFYHVALLFLSPFCILGGLYVLRLLSRNKIHVKYLSIIFVVALLIPVFLFQTGYIYEVFKERSYSVPLSSYRFDYTEIAHAGVIDDPGVYGARWLSRNTNTTTFTDTISMAYICYESVSNALLLEKDMYFPSGSTIFLPQYAFFSGARATVYINYNYANVTEVIPSLNEMNMIYSSGSCHIYEVP